MYSNGIVLAVGKSEILVLLAESKEHVNIIIRGLSPKDVWEQIFTDLLNANQVFVELLSPSDIFANTKPFPLVLDDIPSISPDQLSTFDDANRQFILYGKCGEVQSPPTYPWSFPDEISLKKSHQFQDLQTLKLKPPRGGKSWENLQHQQQFELVSSAFESFLGVDGTRQFKLDKIVIFHNPDIESKFRKAYNNMVNQPDSNTHKKKQNKDKLWQEAIMSKVIPTLFSDCCK